MWLFMAALVRNANPEITHGAEIAVGCPGRYLDHLYAGALNLSHLEVLVIDKPTDVDMGSCRI